MFPEYFWCVYFSAWLWCVVDQEELETGAKHYVCVRLSGQSAEGTKAKDTPFQNWIKMDQIEILFTSRFHVLFVKCKGIKRKYILSDHSIKRF